MKSHLALGFGHARVSSRFRHLGAFLDRMYWEDEVQSERGCTPPPQSALLQCNQQVANNNNYYYNYNYHNFLYSIEVGSFYNLPLGLVGDRVEEILSARRFIDKALPHIGTDQINLIGKPLP